MLLNVAKNSDDKIMIFFSTYKFCMFLNHLWKKKTASTFYSNFGVRLPLRIIQKALEGVQRSTRFRTIFMMIMNFVFLLCSYETNGGKVASQGGNKRGGCGGGGGDSDSVPRWDETAVLVVAASAAAASHLAPRQRSSCGNERRKRRIEERRRRRVPAADNGVPTRLFRGCRGRRSSRLGTTSATPPQTGQLLPPRHPVSRGSRPWNPVQVPIRRYITYYYYYY